MKETILSYTEKGHGKTDGKRVILGSVKGDELLVELIRKRRGMHICKITEVLQPSENRVSPKCAHSGSCGGCSWQQIKYEEQRRIKEEKVRSLFSEVKIHPILYPEDPWEYRNKMEFSFSENKAGEKFLGLILAGSKGHVFDVEECSIASPKITQILSDIRKWWHLSDLSAYHGYKDTGSLRTLTIREGKRTGELLVMLTVSGNADFALRKSQIEAFKATVPEMSAYIRIQQAIKGMPTQFYEMHLHGKDTLSEILYLPNQTLTLELSPSSFFQPNTLMAEKLYTRAIEMLSPSKEDAIADLYCGIGSIGMAFAPHCKSITGIEINPYSVFDARHNLVSNEITNMEVLKGDVTAILKENPRTFDAVIVDPPRMGLGPNAIEPLINLNAKKILYISCNPKTQAEDILALEERGYRLQEVQPVDQFPHTPHIENIALLIKT